MSINKIGVENFRVFKNYTEFEIRSITLLTGPNNSGKSSFTKLLLLLSNGLSNLNFKTGKHHLGEFDKVLSWENDSNNFKIQLSQKVTFFKDLDLEYTYKDGKISNINISKHGKTFIEYSFNLGEPIEWAIWAGDYSMNESFSINIENLIEFIYTGNFEINNTYFEESNWTSIKNEAKFKSDEGNMIYSKDIDMSNYRSLEFIDDINDNLFAAHGIWNEIKKLEKDYLLFDLIIDGQLKTKENKALLRKLQKKAFKKIFLEHPVDTKEPDIIENYLFSLKEVFREAQGKFRSYIKTAFKDISNDHIDCKVSQLGKIIFKENWFEFEYFDDETGESIFQQFSNVDLHFRSIFKNVDYLSATRGNHRRVLQNKSETEIDKIVADYIDNKIEGFEFLNEAFEIMQIPGKLVPERYENTISVIYLKRNERKIALSDLGFGFSQLIPIFLKIIMSKDTLIIEEPEANLHPDLQSKLADLLTLAVKMYPSKKFIIETHSEYLIRRLQYLTAKNEIDSNKSVIYYFNSDKYVSEQEAKVKKIEINAGGNLTDSFGPGFYDEATRLQFDLLKINREQNN